MGLKTRQPIIPERWRQKPDNVIPHTVFIIAKHGPNAISQRCGIGNCPRTQVFEILDCRIKHRANIATAIIGAGIDKWRKLHELPQQLKRCDGIISGDLVNDHRYLCLQIGDQ